MSDIDEDVRVLSEALAAPFTSERWNFLCTTLRITRLLAALQSERDRADAAERDASRLEDALHSLQSWVKAYPLTVFPEPDFAKAARVLGDAGMTLGAISASNMRHVVTKVGAILDAALSQPTPQGETK